MSRLCQWTAICYGRWTRLQVRFTLDQTCRHLNRDSSLARLNPFLGYNRAHVLGVEMLRHLALIRDCLILSAPCLTRERSNVILYRD